jgi:hypothetical protein
VARSSAICNWSHICLFKAGNLIKVRTHGVINSQIRKASPVEADIFLLLVGVAG